MVCEQGRDDGKYQTKPKQQQRQRLNIHSILMINYVILNLNLLYFFCGKKTLKKNETESNLTHLCGYKIQKYIECHHCSKRTTTTTKTYCFVKESIDFVVVVVHFERILLYYGDDNSRVFFFILYLYVYHRVGRLFKKYRFFIWPSPLWWWWL